MARVKVSGKFSSAQQAAVALVHFTSAFATDKTIKVGPTEGNVYLPIYCPEIVQTTIKSALEGLGAVDVTVDPG
jgi:fumarate hydratase class II